MSSSIGRSPVSWSRALGYRSCLRLEHRHHASRSSIGGGQSTFQHGSVVGLPRSGDTGGRQSGCRPPAVAAGNTKEAAVAVETCPADLVKAPVDKVWSLL